MTMQNYEPTDAMVHHDERSHSVGSQWFTTCADQLKAIADPLRLQIIAKLVTGPKSVSEIAQATGDQLMRVSHHLSVMRHANLVTVKKQGRFVVYALHPELFADSNVGVTEYVLTFAHCRLVLPVPRSDLADEERLPGLP